MALRTPARAPRGDLLDGAFVLPSQPDGVLHAVSPADLSDTIGEFTWSEAHAGRAVANARRALSGWRRAAATERAEKLRAYAAALKCRRERFAVAIARSIGKPLWEARTEADALVAKVEITLTSGLELVAPRSLPDATGTIRFRPVGVCAVIGPFNFPAHLPNGHLVPALATGNTVVFKPSERAPEVGELMAECFLEAGFPPGVAQVVQGGAAVAQALVRNPDVDAVMFTGSTAVGSAILAQSAQWPGRMLALELGGKNAALVLADADLAHAAREIAFAAYVTAGQRCTATSRVLVERSVADALLEQLAFAAKNARVGAPDGDDVFLGPVISEGALARGLEGAAALADTHEAVVPLHAAEVPGVRGHYAQPGLYLRRPGARAAAAAEHEELFAPLLTVEVVDSADEAIGRANATRYGLAASVFTADVSRFERAAAELAVGVCNWNRGTVGSSSKLPFGGVKDSGNHRAAGLFSSYYCVDPVAELRVERPGAPARVPGLRFPGDPVA